MDFFTCRICEVQQLNDTKLHPLTDEYIKMLQAIYPSFRSRQSSGDFPGCLCSSCVNSLTEAYSFQRKVMESEEKLWKNASPANPKKKIKLSKPAAPSSTKTTTRATTNDKNDHPLVTMFDEVDPLAHTIFDAPVSSTSEASMMEALKQELESVNEKDRHETILKHLRQFIEPIDRNGLKTVSCKICGDECTNTTNCYRHIKCRHFRSLFNEYSCQYCSFKSPRKDKVTRHVQNSHKDILTEARFVEGDGPFKYHCNSCSKKFRTTTDLDLHVTGNRCKSFDQNVTIEDTIEIEEEVLSH